MTYTITIQSQHSTSSSSSSSPIDEVKHLRNIGKQLTKLLYNTSNSCYSEIQIIIPQSFKGDNTIKCVGRLVLGEICYCQQHIKPHISALHISLNHIISHARKNGKNITII